MENQSKYLFFYIFFSICSSNINKMMNYVKSQKELMNNIYKETIQNQNDLKNLIGNENGINPNIYGLDLINSAKDNLGVKYENFNKDLYKIQKHKFRFQVSALILFIIITIIGVGGYWLRRDYLPLISSMLLLLLAAPVFVMAGLETTYTFLSIDFCSSIGNSIISGIIPSEDKGLGTYLSCPPKETLLSISTAVYEYIVNFDYLFNQTETILENIAWLNESLGEDKRNNDYFKDLYETVEQKPLPVNKTKDDEEKKDIILRNLKCLGIINVIIAGLLSMTTCYTSRNSINYIEENYCYKNHGYMFRNVIFDMISAIFFIITSVGLNKLIVTMKSKYARALRGKKEFNNDIINDDE